MWTQAPSPKKSICVSVMRNSVDIFEVQPNDPAEVG